MEHLNSEGIDIIIYEPTLGDGSEFLKSDGK